MTTGDLTQWRKCTPGEAIKATLARVSTSGWGHDTRVDRVEVQWLGGGRDVVHNVDADQILSIMEERPLAGPTLPRWSMDSVHVIDRAETRQP